MKFIGNWAFLTGLSQLESVGLGEEKRLRRVERKDQKGILRRNESSTSLHVEVYTEKKSKEKKILILKTDLLVWCYVLDIIVLL